MRAAGTRRADALVPMGGLRFARFDALTPPMRDFLITMAADQEWANRYCGLNAETVNPDEFFATPAA